MTDLVVQASFNSGEWSPNLYARVDLTKYKSGAALLENFTVDYRGGASTRPGSKYVLQAKDSANPVRLITFQASTYVGYALELGQNYIRFYFDGAPIVESAKAITGATQANPCAITAVGHGYSTGDWVYLTNILGMTQLNGRYFIVTVTDVDHFSLATLNGTPLDSTAYTAYTSSGQAQRVYTLASPWAAADLALLKFAQQTNEMILCHPDYPPYVLTLVSATNWTLNPITFGTTITAPTGVTVTSTLGGGSVNYSYVVTSIDGNGQESEPSAPAGLANKADIRSTAGSNQITWSPVAGAVGYNIYEAAVSYFGVVPPGVNYGFIGVTKGTTFIDSNIAANFGIGPPIAENPFVGSGISFITPTVFGTYTAVPTVTTSGGSPAIVATIQASLGSATIPTISAAGTGYNPGDTINIGNGVVVTVLTVTAGAIDTIQLAASGSITSGSTPANPRAQVTTSGTGTGASFTVTWGLTNYIILAPGAGYTSVPTIVVSAGAAAGTATLAAATNGNPSVPSFFQQRLVLAAPTVAPQTFNMSRPGLYFNFDISDPAVASDAITETLVSTVQENIKAIASTNAGMLILTDRASWLVNGGSSGSAVSPTSIVANRQSSNGASDVPPITANYDILYVDSKGSNIRDLTYNIYFNTFTGSDISVISSHLFFGYNINEWAWANAPYYVVWAVRSDGVMLTLTFLKDQEFVGWTHQVTSGLYKSVCAVTEATALAGNVDAVYTVAQRTVNGVSVQYIERIADRVFPNGLAGAWCVDAGVQYTGSPASAFTGAEHLAGLTVTGLADGVIIPPFVMPASGQFTLSAPASTVTVGLGFTCKLQTLAIDAGATPIQGKLKRIPDVTVRVRDTLGLSIGSSFSSLFPMKDLVLGNVSSMLTGLGSQVVTGLVTGDARTIIDPTWNVPGQYCIQQSNPYPATVLGVFPHLVLGDTD